MVAGHGVIGDGGHLVADRAEGPGSPVVAVVGQAVLDADAELAGEAVDLGAAAVIGAGGGQEDFGAVRGDGEARVAGRGSRPGRAGR